MNTEQYRKITAAVVVAAAILLWISIPPKIIADPFRGPGEVAPAQGDSQHHAPGQPNLFDIRTIPIGDIRYVAVGDSYTCGTGATPEEAWPALLTNDLKTKGIPI